MLGVKVGVIQNMQSFDDKQRRLRRRRHLRHQLRVRLRLPARQHGRLARGGRAARPPLRDRRRGRQHPDRRGAHAADHLRARPRRRPTLPPVRAARADAQGRPEDRTRSTKLGSDGEEPDYDYEYDEKHKTVAPTERGVDKAEKFLGIENLYLAEHGNLVNHLIQALKAESLYKRDKEYAVIDGEVKIIDEFTGRILEGRRWSEGLHQAVEAKEGVDVREENQTLATITLQNYFRMYDKLAGMTGTALTEANEFIKIYKLPVVDIPTNQPMVRARPQRPDLQDQGRQVGGGRATRSRRATRRASRCWSARSPSRSPRCCRTTLQEARRQARRAEREARARASARARRSPRPGRPGAVTIATNMAGRGVDIMLGGNPEHLTPMELRKLGVEPDDESWDETYEQVFPKIKERDRRRPRAGARSSAACSSSAPSATSPAASTTSCAAAPAARATRASRASTSPPRTTWSASSPATGSTGSSTGSGPSTTTAASSRSRPRCSRARSRTRRRRSRSRTS